MKKNTRHILTILYILSWIIFVGVCIEAGGFIVNAVMGVVNPGIVERLWHEADLSPLLQYDRGHFVFMTLIMGIAATMKGWLFYLIIKFLHDKKLDLARPFSREMQRFIFNVAYVALLIGLFSAGGASYADWLSTQGVPMPGIGQMRLAGADVWLFMSVVLFVIALVFKRGVEIQAENELTI